MVADRALRDAALGYADRGWSVFPVYEPGDGPARCSCANESCDSPAKHPRTQRGLQDGTTDGEAIRGWWASCPAANVAIVTGATSGLVVLDVDPRHGGEEALRDLETQYASLSMTVTAETGGGGLHYYFALPLGLAVRNSAGRLGPGLDVRCDGGYVVAPPSRHSSGGQYAWLAEGHPDDCEPATIPEWLLVLLTERNVSSSRPPDDADEAGDGRIPEGQRNDSLASLAGKMLHSGMTNEEIAFSLLAVNEQRCAPPLSEGEVLRIVQSIGRYSAPAAESPRRLRRALSPPEPFPIEALGGVLAPAARAIHARVQVPLAVAAQSVLAAATLGAQAHADVVLPFGQRRPLSAYYVSVAESGDRKTSGDTLALAAVRDFEASLREAYREELATYESDRDLHESERRHVLNSRRDYPDRDVKRRALDELGLPPSAPLIPMLTAPEPTFEGLTRLFAEGRPALGLFGSEGAQFLGGHGMSPDHRLKTAAGLSGLWDGEPLRRVRAGDGSSVLPGRRLSMHLMLQPYVAPELLADQLLAGQGLLSRLLPAAPESLAGSRFWREPDAASELALVRYNDDLGTLLERALPLAPGTTNELAPRPLPFGADAKRMWVAFVDHVEAQLGTAGDLAAISAFAAKAGEHAVRLGAVLALVDDFEARTLDAEHLSAGIALSEYYLSEWQRLHDASVIRPELRRAEQLLAWLQGQWTDSVIGLPELYQLGPAAIRDARSAREAMLILADHEWVIPINDDAVVRGVRRREAWRIVRKEVE